MRPLRVWLMSDLHLDVYGARDIFKLPKKAPAHDVVVIAGDIMQDMCEGVRWIDRVGLNAKPVIYIGGNHEFYGMDRRANLAEARICALTLSNIYVMQDQEVSFRIDDVVPTRFLCATLWTDYRLDGIADEPRAKMSAKHYLNDHRHIRVAIDDLKNRTYRDWSPDDAAAEHKISKRFLARHLGKPFDGATVVVTHHAPSRLSIGGRYTRSHMNGAYASNLDDLAAKADCWVHGHIHERKDYTIGKCRVLANPRGYQDEESCVAFKPGLVVGMEQRETVDARSAFENV